MPTDQQMAQLALQFFSRLDFKGSELQQAVMLNNWLQGMTQQKEEGNGD